MYLTDDAMTQDGQPYGDTPDILLAHNAIAQRCHVSTLGDDSSDEELESLDAHESFDNLTESDLFGWNLVNSETLDDPKDLSAEEMLGEDFEREVVNYGASVLFLKPTLLLKCYKRKQNK